MTNLPRDEIIKPASALPFWLSLGMVPLVFISATQGGWWLISLPLYSWGMFSVLDAIIGTDTDNPDLDTKDEDLFWYRLITLLWFPIQFVIIFGTIAYATYAGHLSSFEKVALFFGIGVVSGTIGINYSHELMHKRSRLERWLADLLLASVLYSHFRSEHLLVHHRYVCTARDAVTARYNESFYHFFARVLHECPKSAWNAEAEKRTHKNLPALHSSNPFLRYAVLKIFMLILAFMIGGWSGLGLFVFQAFIAIWQLELVNYIEHYGLIRKHLENGKYEHVAPRHAWNAAHKASNWLLINLQRHSDHHCKPDRRFPLLQNYTDLEAPSLPYGYPVMTMAAMIPSVFRRMMNPRVRKWRAMYYPEIVDWTSYK